MKPNSRVLVLPAGIEQVQVIQKAKRRGLFVVAADPSPKAEGFAYADACELASPRDIERCLGIAIQHRVEAVVADQCDYSLFASACIADKLGLFGPSLDAAHNGTNKKLMRERCQEAGLAQPPFAVCRTLADVRRAVEELGLPVIFKPTDNRGCYGVSKAERWGELADSFYEALFNAHSREVLVERFIVGTMVTVDGYFFSPDCYRVLGVASKKKIEGRRCVDMEVMYPAELPAETTQRLLDYNACVVKALKLSYGATHGEYVIGEDGAIYLVEIANRGGGVLTAPVILPAISGVDVPDLLIRNAFGEFPTPEEAGLSREGVACVLTFVDFGSRGVLRGVHGLDEARQVPGVLAVHLFAKIGEELPVITNGPTRHGFIIGKSGTREGARQLVRQAVNAIKLETGAKVASLGAPSAREGRAFADAELSSTT